MAETLVPEVTSTEARVALAAAAVLTRAGHLLAIDRALQRHYGERAVLRDTWLRVPYPELGGQSALALMLTGIEGIKRVRKLVEAADADQRRD